MRRADNCTTRKLIFTNQLCNYNHIFGLQNFCQDCMLQYVNEIAHPVIAANGHPSRAPTAVAATASYKQIHVPTPNHKHKRMLLAVGEK